MAYLETIMTYNAKTHTEGYIIGSTMTYVDIALWHTLVSAASQFPEAYARVSVETLLLEQFRAKIASVPKI